MMLGLPFLMIVMTGPLLMGLVPLLLLSSVMIRRLSLIGIFLPRVVLFYSKIKPLSEDLIFMVEPV